MATGRKSDSKWRTEELQCCQRRLEYLSSRLQDLALEIGDGQGAVWLKDNMWFLNKPAMYFDDVLFSVGKICNHLVSYLTFHKQKLQSCFPFLSFMGILYEVGEILGCVRDMLLVNPSESLSLKQSQIDLFWQDCTPFLFVFENSNHLLLGTAQIPLYMRALLDLVPSVIQVGVCMYCAQESKLRGFDSFAETCIRLSKALVESGDFLQQAEQKEPVIVPFLRQWILYALELVQNGVKVRTDMAETSLTPRVSEQLLSARKEYVESHISPAQDALEQTIPKRRLFSALSLSQDSSLPDDVAESSLAPLKIRNSCLVRTSCQPFRWIEIAHTRVGQCPNERRKAILEEISLKENQKVISDIFLLRGKQPRSWKAVKIHCPLTKIYDEVKVKLFVKVKIGEEWEAVAASYDNNFGKGHFLVFDGCNMSGFVAIEERPMTRKQIGPSGGRVSTQYDSNMEATIPESATTSKAKMVKMMVQPTDGPRERIYRDTCPDDFRYVACTSSAVELDGTNMERNVSLKIPFKVLSDPNTKILILRYLSDSDSMEITEAERTDSHCYTVDSGDGGTVLAAVNQENYDNSKKINISQEMAVLLGRKHLCKLLLFVETQHSPSSTQNINDIVMSVVCVEKYRIAETIREQSKVGLIELPKSQSPDRLLKQADEIKLEVKGSVSLDPDIPTDAYTLTYLEGSDNYVRFPLRIADCNGRLTVVLRLGRDNSVLHTFFCNVPDLLDLIVQRYVDSDFAHAHSTRTSRHMSEDDDDVFTTGSASAVSGKVKDTGKEKETEMIKEPTSKKQYYHKLSGGVTDHTKSETSECITPPPPLTRQSTSSTIIQEEPDGNADLEREASLKILNRNSLVNLAKQIKNDESHVLGVCLGMRQEKLSQIYRTYRHSSSLATFYVLYEWRGRKSQPELADTLIKALQDVGRRDLANIVIEVRKENRALAAEDFAHLRRRSARLR